MASDDPMTDSDSDMDEYVCFRAWVEADWEGGFWEFQRKHYPNQIQDQGEEISYLYDEIQEGRRDRQSLRTTAIAGSLPAVKVIAAVVAGYDGERVSWELTEDDKRVFDDYNEFQLWQALGGREVGSGDEEYIVDQ
jgi:hypothetical protein